MATQQGIENMKETLFFIPWQTKLQATLPVERVSVVLHEPAILGGYRVPNQPWRYYLLSLFQLHNETVNVWTHLIGCCIILYQLYSYFDEFDLFKDSVLSTIFVYGITCLIGLFTSAIVHLVHTKSSYVHFLAFMVDYIGATFMSFGSGIAMFYGMSQKNFYDNWKNLYLPCLTLSSYLNFVNLCVAKIWYGHDPHNMKRKYMLIGGFVCQAVIGMSSYFPRYVDCFVDNNCSVSSLNYQTFLTLSLVIEAIAFGAHQPEKTWPGKFDIVGHGHQIFHVLVALIHVLHMNAVYHDHVTGQNHHGEPDLISIIVIMIVMYVVDVLTLVYLKRYVPVCLKRVEEAEKQKDH